MPQGLLICQAGTGIFRHLSYIIDVLVACQHVEQTSLEADKQITGKKE